MLNYILPFLALILVVVFIHEYGHYYFAKKYGVKVTDFSIGFGQELFGWNDKSGTRWKICWIPLGGYVKFFGDRNVFSQADQEEIIKKYTEDERKELFLEKNSNLIKIQNKMDKLTISPSKVSKFGVNIAKDGVSRSANQILSQKSINMSKIREIWPEIPYVSREIDEQLEINSHYKGYLKKQKADILAFKRDENLIIPDNINYDSFSGLSNEVKSKFKKIKPKTMGQALRIDAVSYTHLRAHET